MTTTDDQELAKLAAIESQLTRIADALERAAAPVEGWDGAMMALGVDAYWVRLTYEDAIRRHHQTTIRDAYEGRHTRTRIYLEPMGQPIAPTVAEDGPVMPVWPWWPSAEACREWWRCVVAILEAHDGR